MSKITDCILQKLGNTHLLEKLNSLSASEWNTVMLELMKNRKATPSKMLKSFSQNRFSVPSEFDPIDYHQFEVMLLQIAKDINIDRILLSPVAPFGNCSVFGCVDQNNVVSATRGTEVLADPTNMLATIISSKLKAKQIGNSSPKHFCTSARTTRAPPLLRKESLAHFGLFCIASTGKDTGSYTTEKELLLKQLQYYKLLLFKKYNATLFITLRKRGGYTDGDGFFERMSQLIQEALPDTSFNFDFEHTNNQYYKGINFKIYMQKENEKIEIGDGGFVDWAQQMTGNKKERLLISGISIERMMTMQVTS